jgi:threonine synthase
LEVPPAKIFLSMNIHCTNCHRPYPEQGASYHCPACGGLFDISELPAFDPNQVDPLQPGLWRYRQALGLPGGAPQVTLGEGNTPLVESEAFGRAVFFKCEYQNPTGSFKDRGSAVIASFLKSRRVEKAVEDSSGNAGASFAAYAARARIAARIYLPDSASGPKRLQIQAYGVELVRIMGPRSNATRALVLALEKEPDLVYASHAYLPVNLAGYATMAYEMVEQLGQAPGAVVAPAGQGGLLLGLGRGFESLQRAGQIEQVPHLVGVQARACAPLWALYAYGPAGLHWVTEEPTLAEGVRVSQPLRGDALLNLLAAHGGRLLAVDEQEILPGRDELAHRGFYVEPTSAIVWNAMAQASGSLPEPVVVVLTGSGLKSGQ